MNFDIAMPFTLLAVTIAAMFLYDRVEGKLKSTFEERKIRTRDVFLLVAAISVMVSMIVFIPQLFLMIVFLVSYSALLLIFTYLFSDFRKNVARIYCLFFLVISFLTGTFSFTGFGMKVQSMYGGLVFYFIFGFSFLALIYEELRVGLTERWYLAILPPAYFVSLYMFFSGTNLWFPYLLNSFGIMFAILIITYLGILFTWKTSLVFFGLLTLMDVILVLFTGSMVSAARHVSSLRLPMVISMPALPLIITQWGILFISLGLGDFFFAGLIGVQSMKKFGKRFAIFSVIAMSVSFFIFETMMLNSNVMALPGTLMIICGWLPMLVSKMISERITV